jgi:RNA polymerase sigma-70 factor (ECF subfamily)
MTVEGVAPRRPAEVQLLAACARGETEAWSELFEAYKARVYSLAWHLTGDPPEAEDVTQEVFLKLINRLGQFRSEARFSTWLYRIVVNTTLDRRRARRRLLPLHQVGLPPLLAAQERGAMRAEARQRVQRALQSLSPKLRAVVALRYGSGLSYAEIGAVLGLSEGTVASRLSRALVELGKSLPEGRELLP